MKYGPTPRNVPSVLGGLVAAVFTLGVLLAAPETDGCATCADVPPFVATRTELLIYNPPPPPPTITRYE